MKTMRTLALPALLLPLAATGCLRAGASDAEAPVGKSYGTAGQYSTYAAPVVNGPPAPMNDGTFQIGGLRYVEFVTGGASAEEQLPMVVALHGNGGSGSEFSRYFANFPGRARFIVPFGPNETGRGFQWFPAVRRMSPEELSQRLPPAVERVAAAIAGLERSRPTTGRATVVGFSQGAVLAYGLAVRHPELFSTACPFAGQIPDAVIGRPTGAVVIHGFHGDYDDTVRYAEGQRTVATLQRSGYSADLTTLPGVGHNFNSASPYVGRCIQADIATR